MIILRRKSYTDLPKGVTYLSSQLENSGDKVMDFASDSLLDPIGDSLEKVEELPLVRDIKPKSVSRYKKLTRNISKLIKGRRKSDSK